MQPQCLVFVPAGFNLCTEGKFLRLLRQKGEVVMASETSVLFPDEICCAAFVTLLRITSIFTLKCVTYVRNGCDRLAVSVARR